MDFIDPVTLWITIWLIDDLYTLTTVCPSDNDLYPGYPYPGHEMYE